jgi:hypothetical protein
MLARLKFKLDNLVNDILSHIPNDLIIHGTILDPAMGGGQFVKEIERRKRAAGKTDEEIRKTVFGIESNILRRNYAVNKHKLVGDYQVGNALTMDFNGMKFDVVIGNPPYQDLNKNPLYYKFHNMVVSKLMAPNGILAFVTPDAMAVSIETGIVKGCHKVEQREILLLNTSKSIKDIYFKDIGISGFCYYVLRNSPKSESDYPIITDDGKISGRMNPLKPKLSSPFVYSILAKCFEFSINTYSGIWSTAGKAAIIDPNGLGKVALRIGDNDFEIYNVVWRHQHKYHNVPKLFISAYGDAAMVAYDHSLVCASEKLLFTVPTKSDEESERLLALLDCKLKKYLTIVINARGPYVDFVRHFRGVDLSKVWTDDELYTHFKLTQEEIDHIETTITKC